MLIRSLAAVVISLAVVSCSESSFSAKKVQNNQLANSKSPDNLSSSKNESDVSVHSSSIGWGSPCHMSQRSMVGFDEGFEALVYCNGSKWKKVPQEDLNKMGSTEAPNSKYKLVDKPYKPVTSSKSVASSKTEKKKYPASNNTVMGSQGSEKSYRCKTAGPEKSFRCRQSVPQTSNLAH